MILLIAFLVCLTSGSSVQECASKKQSIQHTDKNIRFYIENRLAGQSARIAAITNFNPRFEYSLRADYVKMSNGVSFVCSSFICSNQIVIVRQDDRRLTVEKDMLNDEMTQKIISFAQMLDTYSYRQFSWGGDLSYVVIYKKTGSGFKIRWFDIPPSHELKEKTISACRYLYGDAQSNALKSFLEVAPIIVR